MCRYDSWSHPLYATKSNCTGVFRSNGDYLTCGRDLIFDVFWLATGQEERHWTRNKHGHFDLTGTVVQREQVLRLALGSSIGGALQNALRTVGLVGRIPRWPHGKHAAACVGHDVDYRRSSTLVGAPPMVLRQSSKGLAAAWSVLAGIRHHWHFHHGCSSRQGLDTRSAFYFVPRQGSLLEYARGTPDPLLMFGPNAFASSLDIWRTEDSSSACMPVTGLSRAKNDSRPRNARWKRQAIAKSTAAIIIIGIWTRKTLSRPY